MSEGAREECEGKEEEAKGGEPSAMEKESLGAWEQ